MTARRKNAMLTIGQKFEGYQYDDRLCQHEAKVQNNTKTIR